MVVPCPVFLPYLVLMRFPRTRWWNGTASTSDIVFIWDAQMRVTPLRQSCAPLNTLLHFATHYKRSCVSHAMPLVKTCSSGDSLYVLWYLDMMKLGSYLLLESCCGLRIIQSFHALKTNSWCAFNSDVLHSPMLYETSTNLICDAPISVTLFVVPAPNV